MATLKELKNRIGSVSSSEKITGAMKMISSAKVRKSEAELKRLSPFKTQIKTIMAHLLSAGENYSSPLTEIKDVKKIGLVVFGSDDGLCGAYNVNIFKYLLSQIKGLRKEYGDGVELCLYPVGKKMTHAMAKYVEITPGVTMQKVVGVDSKMQGDVVNTFTMNLQEAFTAGDLDMVKVVYMQFKTIGKQVAMMEQLFPVDKEAIAREANSVSGADTMYIFEPDPNRIFNEVLPMFVLSMMQEVTIQNRASEQAARIMAMQAANDNAKKLLESLQLEYNKLRQQGITTELLDILGGQVGK
jgi:F-type H+-transporting ATPase subunit gamma